MRRIVGLAILTVVLATLLNLGLAIGVWWLGGRPPTPDEKLDTGNFGIVDVRPQELVIWRDCRGSEWPREPEVASSYEYFGVSWRTLTWFKVEYSGPPEDDASKATDVEGYSIDIVELGWPIRCLAGEGWTERHGLMKPPKVTSGLLVVFGYQWPNRVLWLGMIVDELFYVLLIVSTFFSWRYGKRWLRRHFGRCPLCAYDLRGDLSSGCPECGWRRGDAHDACGYSSAASST